MTTTTTRHRSPLGVVVGKLAEYAEHHDEVEGEFGYEADPGPTICAIAEEHGWTCREIDEELSSRLSYKAAYNWGSVLQGEGSVR